MTILSFAMLSVITKLVLFWLSFLILFGLLDLYVSVIWSITPSTSSSIRRFISLNFLWLSGMKIFTFVSTGTIRIFPTYFLIGVIIFSPEFDIILSSWMNKLTIRLIIITIRPVSTVFWMYSELRLSSTSSYSSVWTFISTNIWLLLLLNSVTKRR